MALTDRRSVGRGLLVRHRRSRHPDAGCATRAATRPAAGSVAIRPAVPTFALISSALSPLLLVGGWSIANVLQPPGYNPMRQTVSVLAGQTAHYRWVMTGALLGIGVCHFVTTAGLRILRGAARACLMIAGLVSIGIALSPATADGTGTRHLAFTALGAVAIAIWPALVGRRAWRHSAVLGIRGSAIVAAVFIGLFGWFVAEAAFGGPHLGLAERVASGLQICWPCVVAVAGRKIRTSSPAGHDRPPSSLDELEGPRPPCAARANQSTGQHMTFRSSPAVDHANRLHDTGPVGVPAQSPTTSVEDAAAQGGWDG